MGTLTGYYTTVQKILSNMTSNTMRVFTAQNNDEDRFTFFSRLDFVRDAFKGFTPTINEGKSALESKNQREKGNSFYERREFRSALECYTKAILVAPLSLLMDGSSEEMVLALGNRSATLFQMERYDETLTDIRQALHYGYPIHLQYKIFDRQARCHLKQGDLKEALEAFENVLKVLKESKLDEKQQENTRKNAEKQIDICRNKVDVIGLNSTVSSASKQKSSHPPAMSVPSSFRYPNACQAFDVKFNGEKGRYGVACKDIGVGDVVIAENPYVYVLDPSQLTFRCYHCFKQLGAPVGCYQCCRVRYCTETCRAASWDAYHQVECPYLGLLVSSGTGKISLLALRIMIVTGIVKVLKCKQNPKSDKPEAQHALFTDSKGVFLGGFVGLYGLLAQSEHRAPNDLLQYTMLSFFISTILKKAGYFSSDDKVVTQYPGGMEKIQGVVGGIILRFLQIIACNGIEVCEMSIGDNLQKSHPECVGLGLFPTASLLNHACDPNVEFIFYEEKCIARALRNIPAGKEINIDYGYLYYITPKQQRQLALRSQYYFECKCAPCVNKWGTKASLKCDIPILKCTQCSVALTEAAHSSNVTCPRCGKVQNPMELFERLQRSSRQYEKALDDARKFQIHKAIPLLEEHMRLMDKYVCLPWKDYVTCSSMLKQCYRMLGNRARRHAGNTQNKLL